MHVYAHVHAHVHTHTLLIGPTSHNATRTTGHGSSADAEVFAEEGKPLNRKTLKHRKEKIVKF